MSDLVAGAAGGVVGSAVVAILSAVQAGWDRKQRTDEASRDRQHALDLEQLHDAQRLRDRRLERIRDDVAEVAQRGFELSRAAAMLRSRQRVGQAIKVWVEAQEKYQLILARLVTEPSLEPLAKSIGKLLGELQMAAVEAGSRATAAEAMRDDLPDISERLNRHLDEIEANATQLIADAREQIGALDSAIDQR